MAWSGTGRQRLFAVLALVAAGLLLLTVVWLLRAVLWPLLFAAIGAVLVSLGGWRAITESGGRRLVGAAVALVGAVVLAAALVLGLDEAATRLGGLVAAVLLGVATLGFARAAVAESLRRIELSRAFPPFRPRHAVLICNPRSGEGKVDQFDLVGQARQLGVEVVLLQPGDDLEALARDAVARGADCLGMAGGDGSQALVADVAVRHAVPFVCIAAGTRNHFALDLGLDATDPTMGLAAFRGGVLRRVDFARAGGRLFVNNVSLGVYAQIVEKDGYREAKVATARAELPELLGSQAEPFDLQFTAPDGHEVDGAFVILVSNNPYVLGPRLDLARRRSLSTGELGVVALSAATGPDAAAALVGSVLAGSVLGRPGEGGLLQFTTTRFQVRSRSGRANAGVDGEPVLLDTPVDFTIHPRGLTVLVPADNPVVSAARHVRGFGMRGLWAIARGRQPAALAELT